MDEAKEAINAVFSDTTVSPETTLDRMRELAGDVQMCIDALAADGVE